MILLPGPSLYPLLSTVINRFMVHALLADISKMFRDAGLLDSEKDLLRYLVASKNGLLRGMRMNRLTFGVSCFPFLASQELLQVATD